MYKRCRRNSDIYIYILLLQFSSFYCVCHLIYQSLASEPLKDLGFGSKITTDIHKIQFIANRSGSNIGNESVNNMIVACSEQGSVVSTSNVSSADGFKGADPIVIYNERGGAVTDFDVQGSSRVGDGNGQDIDWLLSASEQESLIFIRT